MAEDQDTTDISARADRPAGSLRLGEAAALLGVSPITLRRWADDGKVASQRTPGGQRRFRREDLQAVQRMEGRTSRWGSRQREQGERGLSAGALREQMLAELVTLGTTSAQTRDIDRLLQQVAERLLTTLRVVNCDIYRLMDDGTLICVMSVDQFGRDREAECGSFDHTWFGPNSRAVLTRQIVVVPRPGDPVLTDDDRKVYKRFGYASEVCVPLLAGDLVVGLIEIYDRRPRDYTKYLDFLKSVGRIVGGAFESSMLLARLEQSNRDLELLVASGRDFSATLDFDQVLRTIALRMCAAAGTAVCDIYSLEDDALVAIVAVEGDLVYTDFVGTRYPLSASTLGRLLVETRAPVEVSDIETDERLTESERGDYRDSQMRSTLILPLLAGGDIVGSAELSDVRIRTFDRVDLLLGLATIAAQAIKNAQLYREKELQQARLASLLDASRAMTSTLVSEDLLDTLVRGLAHVLGSPECLIYEYDAATDSIQAAAIYQDVPDGFADLHDPLPLSDYPSDRKLLDGGVPLVETLSDADVPADVRETMERWGEKTSLSLPLWYKGEPLGILIVNELEVERVFTAAEIELARGFGEQAAVAMHTARIYKAQEQRNRQLTALLESSRAVATAPSLQAALQHVAAGAVAALGVSACVVYEHDRAADTVTPRAFFPAEEAWSEDLGSPVRLADRPIDRETLASQLPVQKTLRIRRCIPTAACCWSGTGRRAACACRSISGTSHSACWSCCSAAWRGSSAMWRSPWQKVLANRPAWPSTMRWSGDRRGRRAASESSPRA